MSDFVHLHLHSHYSIGDGLCRIESLVERARELGFPALALTDHGVMHGAIEFYAAAHRAGVKPIIGMEAYVAERDRHQWPNRAVADTPYHLTLLATNREGYRNLMQLSTKGFLDGFYYRPRVDKALLERHRQGLIALSGCLSGELPRKVLLGKTDQAVRAAQGYQDIFGAENFFIEVQDNGVPEQRQVLEGLQEVSAKTGSPLVATSDIHYIHQSDAKAHDALLCIHTGRKQSDEKRLRMGTDQFYLMSAEEMRERFRDLPEACDRTVEIAARCDLDLDCDFEVYHLPAFPTPEGCTPEQHLRELTEGGLRRRYGDMTDPVRERAEHEFAVIAEMGFVSYFLMVADIVSHAKDVGIPVGPGRGSAAGSIVNYALGITDIDPVEHGLLFERFVNRRRNDIPDIDIDFGQERREEVMAYIAKRFGPEKCARIITFGRLTAKSAIRTVGRTLNVPAEKMDALAGLVPLQLPVERGKTAVEAALEKSPELRERYNTEPAVRELLDLAMPLDQVVRQTGIHAAGVLVADRAVTEYSPLCKRGENVTTQYEMKSLGRMGLCRINILSLKALDQIQRCTEAVQREHGYPITVSSIPLDDKAVYEMLSVGHTAGVFQFEGGGFTELLGKLQPDCFANLSAATAMYRPGPLGVGMVDRYIACKQGREEPEYLHPVLEPVLRETYGILLYQEQALSIARDVAHFDLSEGDQMRRTLGKHDLDQLPAYRKSFVTQAAETVGGKAAGAIFDFLMEWAGYGFNKAHAACYALIAYRMAWLKAHYPRQFEEVAHRSSRD